MYFVLCNILFGYGGEVLKYEGISVQGRMEILPAIAMTCTYDIIEVRNNTFRKFFQYGTFTKFEIDYYRIVRIIIYLLKSMFFLTKGRTMLIDFITNATHIDNLSIDKFNLALKNVDKGYIFSVIYSFVVCIIFECLDIYIKNAAFKINEELR